MDDWIGWLIAVLENGIVVDQDYKGGPVTIRLAQPETTDEKPERMGNTW